MKKQKNKNIIWKLIIVMITLAAIYFLPHNIDEKLFSETENLFVSHHGKIVFESNRNGNLDIYSMNIDGSNQERLTDNSAKEVFSVYSPDGEKIAFCREKSKDTAEIYIMNSDGSDKKKLVEGWDPSFSPDGRKIIFERGKIFGTTDIFTMNIDGSNKVNVSNSPCGYRFPIFSPDGSKVAVSVEGERGTSEIRIIDLARGKIKRIENSMGTAFSPDGNKILFLYRSPFSYVYFKICVIDLQNNKKAFLTNEFDRYFLPIFSPNGSKIAVSRNKGHGTEEIFIMNSDGGNQIKLAELNSYSTSLAFSPDGKKIACSTFYKEKYEIFIMDSDGRNLRKIANDNDLFFIRNPFSP